MTEVDRAYLTNLERTHGFEPLSIEGKLPQNLRGTLYRTGPGLFDSFGKRYHHLFEGDGAMTAIRIAHGEAQGAAQILDTDGLLSEKKAGRPLYGSRTRWLRRMINTHSGRIKNVANTNVVCWQDELLALVESSRPTRVDPDRLTVKGETDFGVLKGPFTAHPHRVPARRASYAYGVRYGRDTKLDLYELPDAGTPRHLTTIDLKFGPMLHDFMATENHLVFFVPPAAVSVPRALLQIGTFKDLFRWHPELGTFVLIVPIDRPDQPIKLKTDAFFQWHFANGFERDGRIYVDFLHHPDFTSFEELSRNEFDQGGTYQRAEIDPAKKSLSLVQISSVPSDFPRVHPSVDAKKHRYSWIISRERRRRLVRIDVESGSEEHYIFDENERPSEAVIAPLGEGELDGFVLTLVYDHRRNKSALDVFDPKSIGNGPVARAWFDHRIPITFHGNWRA